MCLLDTCVRISARFAEFSKDNLERMNVSRAIVDEAIKLAHEKESSLVTKLESELLSGDLYLELGAGGIISVHFKYLDQFMLDMFNKRNKSEITEQQHRKIRGLIAYSIKPFLRERLKYK